MIIKLALAILVGFLIAVVFGLFLRSAAKKHAAEQDEIDDKATKQKSDRFLEGSSGDGEDGS